MRAYYEYVHRPGYGRSDHLADEIIARAWGYMGADTSGYVLASLGLASHPCPMPELSGRVPAAPGVRRRMERALRRAERDVFGDRYVDTWIYVACRRDVLKGGRRVVETRRGNRWELLQTE